MRHLVFPTQRNEEGEPLLIHSIQCDENEEGMPSRPLLSTRRQRGYDPPCPLLVLPLQRDPTRRVPPHPLLSTQQRGGSYPRCPLLSTRPNEEVPLSTQMARASPSS